MLLYLGECHWPVLQITNSFSASGSLFLCSPTPVYFLVLLRYSLVLWHMFHIFLCFIYLCWSSLCAFILFSSSMSIFTTITLTLYLVLLLCLVIQSWLNLCDPMDCSMPGFPVLHPLPEFVQTHVHWIGDAIQLSHHPLPTSPVFNLSQHQDLFQWVSSWITWPKYWSFSFSISLFNEYSRLISFRIDWFDLLAVQGTLKSLLQH